MRKSTLLACAVVLPLSARAAKLTTVYDIPGTNDGAAPSAALLALHGKFYGTTSGGGPANSGTVFKIDPATGAETMIYAFTGGADGGNPTGPLIEVDGILYGTTAAGGAGVGTVFKVDPASGAETVLYSFPVGNENGNPEGALLAYGGLLYGTSQFGGASANGYVFSINPVSGAFTIVYSFRNSFGGGDDGAYPDTALIRHGNMLYGTTPLGGKFGRGTLYQLDPATGAEKALHSFGSNKNDGDLPEAPLVDVNGILYGTASSGGSFSDGTAFAFDLATHRQTTLHSFAGGNDGIMPEAGLLHLGGLLYGTTELGGGSANGTVFSIDPANGATTTLADLGGTDGAAPVAALIDAGGLLYGTALGGGLAGYGTVFAVDPATGQETTLHGFSGTEHSQAAAVIRVGGALYGTSSGGGAYGLGSIYRVDLRTGKGRTAYSFGGAANDGLNPAAPLLLVGGTLYGTTANGGAEGQGTVFSFDPVTRTKTTVYFFSGLNDGANIDGGLINVAGALYGTASNGGASGDGTVFKIDPASGHETTLYAFAGGNDGEQPYSGVVYANGMLYGTTISGGAANDGTVFQIDLATGAETILYAFKGGADGAAPFGGLLYVNGTLFGTTAGFGQKKSNGTVFALDAATGTETVLRTFGAYSGPRAAVIRVGAWLYGSITDDRRHIYGAAFKLNPGNNAFRTLYNFSGGQDGGLPTAALLDIGGALYGTTTSLVSSNAGTVFRLDR